MSVLALQDGGDGDEADPSANEHKLLFACVSDQRLTVHIPANGVLQG